MFEKIRELKRLKELEKILEREKEVFEKNGILVVLRGNLEIEKIEIKKELSKEELEKAIKDCLNFALKENQKKILKVFLKNIKLWT